MDSIPTAPPHQATAANWRQAPGNRWAFQHLRELLPTAEVSEAPDRVWLLPQGGARLEGLTIAVPGGRQITLDQWLAESAADGVMVLKDGAVVFETYRHGLTPRRPHLVFSVSKVLLALVVGILADQGRLDPDAPVTRYLPEVRGGYADTTLRHSLDMTVDLDFDESSTDPEGSVARYNRAKPGGTPCPPERAGDLRSFLASVGRGPGPHGEAVRYITANSDLLAWICERVTGEPFAQLLSRLIWQPLGAERAAYMAVDRLGAAWAGGGFNCTLRDLSRLGEMVRCRGVADGRTVVPGWWIDDIVAGGDPAAWARLAWADMLPPGARYRSQWYKTDATGNVLMGIGSFSQWLWIDRAKGVVIAKVSSVTDASGATYPAEQAAFAAIAEALAR